jgi:hypothetical protein
MYIYEHVIARTYGWTIDAIRAMDYQDFQIHLQLCLVHDTIDKEFVLKSSGMRKSKKAAPDEAKPRKGSGPVKEIRTENIIKF